MFAKRKLIEEGDASAKKRKHKTISMLEKVELLQKLESGTSVRSLCELYGISSSTVYDLKKQKEQIFSYFADNIGQRSLEKRKSLRRGKSMELDTTLLQWFKQCRSEGVSVSGEMMMMRAKVLHRELNLDYNWINCVTYSSVEKSSTILEPVEEGVSLALHEHHSSILKTLFDDSTFADVTLTAEGHLIRAHKAVLSAMSPYFREVLQANPCQHPIIIMPLDVQYENLQGIISYIYKNWRNYRDYTTQRTTAFCKLRDIVHNRMGLI